MCAHVHGTECGRHKGRFVTEGEHYSVDDGNDECFLMMVMRITIVVSVSLRLTTPPSPQTKTWGLLLLLHSAAWTLCKREAPAYFQQ